MTEKLTTQPYKGSRDFFPEEMRIRDYIFGIWRDVCKSYGYSEYDGPFLENFDLYAAKSGEELVNEQLYTFEDKGGRKVAIRPEMTPTLARMVASKYKEMPKPIRWFSIPNLWRYEKPQKGRLREFFQLNVDVLGINGSEADFEIIKIAVDIMKKAGATEKMFELRINDRRFMDDFYKENGFSSEQIEQINKVLDKKSKISESDFEKMLTDIKISPEQIDSILNLIDNSGEVLNEFIAKDSLGAKSIQTLLVLAKNAGIGAYIKFDPTIVRGLAYYTGTVFEQFDLNPENTRAMFGGGRYDDLVSLFVNDSLPATGFGMGDVTFIDFLNSWDLMPQFKNETEYFVTVWPSEDEKYSQVSQQIADNLRNEGRTVEMWLETDTKLNKQLDYANKKGFKKVIIVGEEELKNGTYTLKDMQSGEQESIKI